MLVLALLIKASLIGLASVLTIDIPRFIGLTDSGHASLIAYAPEVWLALLALVFGTLIIVVSIASENTPRLVDIFIGDAWGRLYIWVIMFSTLENVLLQLATANPAMFWSNMMFINNYVLLPLVLLFAIPFTFHILKLTKNTNVIAYIFEENIHAIHHSSTTNKKAIEQSQMVLFETLNQMHDLLQYIQFKEPKGDIISRLGRSVRHYLMAKRSFPDQFFGLSQYVKDDISFRTLQERYQKIESSKIFYEQKALWVLNAVYLHVIDEGHPDLASMCGYELSEIGRTAIQQNDLAVTEAAIMEFNTLLRNGINHALKSKEIGNAFNIIHHYNQLIFALIENKDEMRVERCCHYMSRYGEELYRLSEMEPQLKFLVDVIAWALKKNVMYLVEREFSKNIQQDVLRGFCNLSEISQATRGVKGGLRLIKISLCLFYMSKDDYGSVNSIVDSLSNQWKVGGSESLLREWEESYARLIAENETFWEGTDRGIVNIYFTGHQDQIPRLREHVQVRIGNQESVH